MESGTFPELDQLLGGLDTNETFSLPGNFTDLDQFGCHIEHVEKLVSSIKACRVRPWTWLCYSNSQTNFTGCFPTHDKIFCWPPTSFSSLAIQPCFKELNGVLYSAEGETRVDIIRDPVGRKRRQFEKQIRDYPTCHMHSPSEDSFHIQAL